MESLVAVYGTLRRNGGNHRLLTDSSFLGECKSEPKFTMYDIGCPYVTQSGNTAITLEVYSVTPRTLTYLDMLEGYPDLYNRIKIDTPYGEAWMYVIDNYEFAGQEIVPGGDWMNRHSRSLIV